MNGCSSKAFRGHTLQNASNQVNRLGRKERNMTKKTAFKLALTLLTILFLCNPGAAIEEETFYLFDGADDLNYLSKMRGPNGYFVKRFFWLPGSSASWETTLLGDISDEKYGIGIFLASFSTTKFRVEFIIEQDGGETVLASAFVTANSKKFVRFKRELGGKDLQTKPGDKLIFRISHVKGGGGAVLYGGGPGDDSYITIPPIVAISSDPPSPGKWTGIIEGEDGGVISFVITGDKKFVRDFSIKEMKVPSRGIGKAIKEVEEIIEDAIKIKDNIFRIERNSLSVTGTFTSKNTAIGTWGYSADIGGGLEGCYTAAGKWTATFDTMAVKPKNKLTTTWGKVKIGP